MVFFVLPVVVPKLTNLSENQNLAITTNLVTKTLVRPQQSLILQNMRHGWLRAMN